MTELTEEGEPPQCAACKRALKQPSPTGFGPVCWRKLHGHPGPRPRRSTPTAAPGLGQDELPLNDQLDLFN